PRSRPTQRGPPPGAKAPPPARRNKGRRTSWSARAPCRRRSGGGRATSCARLCGCTGGGSLVRSRQQPGLEPIQRGGNFGLLDGGGGIDVLGTHLRAGADEGAFPNALVAGDHVGPLVVAVVTRIEIVAVRQRERRRADKAFVQPALRTGGVTQQAIYAHAVLFECHELKRSLEIFSVAQRFLLVCDYIRLHAGKLLDETVHNDHQIAFDRKMVEWLDPNHAITVIAQEDVTRELGFAVDHHAA